MSKGFLFALALSSFFTLSGGDNLLINAEFSGIDDQITAWNCKNTGTSPGVVRRPGQGVNGSTALRLDFAVCDSFIQPEIKLAAGEKYRFGAWVRTKDFTSPLRACGLIIYNQSWTSAVNTVRFPSDTGGRWVKLEAAVKMPKSTNGQYTFSVFGAHAKGEFELCAPYLIALSDKGRSESQSMPRWEDNLARVMPYHPLLSQISTDNGELRFCTVRPANGSFDQWFCRVRFAAGQDPRFSEPVDAPFDSNGLCRVFLGPLPQGRGRIKVEQINKQDGKILQSSEYEVCVISPVKSSGTRLNNLVTEIRRGELPRDAMEFDAPENGWYHLTFSAPPAGIKVKLDGRKLVLFPGPNGQAETMLRLPRGRHELNAGKFSGKIWMRIAKIPQLVMFPLEIAEQNYFTADHGTPLKTSRFRYDRNFYRQYLWPSFNTCFLESTWRANAAMPEAELKAELGSRGIALLQCGGFPKSDWKSAAGLENKIRNSVMVKKTSGRCLDEVTNAFTREMLTSVCNLGWNMHNYEKDIHTWFGMSAHPYFTFPLLHRPLIAACANFSHGRGKILLETYIPTAPDPSTAEKTVARYSRHLADAERLVPQAAERFMCFIGGYLLQTQWNIDCYPETDPKYFLDTYIQKLAVMPEARNLAGLGCYELLRSDEENIRWIARLFRHYAIEGNTGLLSTQYGFKLNPGHLRNGDFTEKLKFWKISAAPRAAVTPLKIKRFGFDRQGRRVKNGDSVVQFSGPALQPSTLSQTITGLTPGKLYSLTYLTADPADKGKLAPATSRLDACIGDVELLPNGYCHRSRIWITKIVFRAKKTEAMLTFSDRPRTGAGTSGAPPKSVLNFVAIRPYFAVETSLSGEAAPNRN